eukprot:1159612-Pelagomonas_calceolata.AAC.9
MHRKGESRVERKIGRDGACIGAKQFSSRPYVKKYEGASDDRVRADSKALNGNSRRRRRRRRTSMGKGAGLPSRNCIAWRAATVSVEGRRLA